MKRGREPKEQEAEQTGKMQRDCWRSSAIASARTCAAAHRLQHFWCDVGRRADTADDLAASKRRGEAEIAELEVALRGHVWLGVAVQDAAGMQVLESSKQLLLPQPHDRLRDVRMLNQPQCLEMLGQVPNRLSRNTPSLCTQQASI